MRRVGGCSYEMLIYDKVWKKCARRREAEKKRREEERQKERRGEEKKTKRKRKCSNKSEQHKVQLIVPIE